ncbi:MAG: M15 family metallopeptidase, partial [Christensenellales bacterium]|nr:M15 family metallopeptidase [Christensenellales bacterium]
VVYIKGSEIEGNREAVDKLMEMLRAAIADGLGDWQISAGYRSVAYQQQLWDNRVYEYRQQGLSASEAQSATARYVAVPGSSEHHTGLAFDVTVPGESFPLTEQSKWLAEHCWDYGFIIRYTEEKEDITGISAEPWHVRYVGQPHARIMRDENWCLEEYIASLTTP